MEDLAEFGVTMVEDSGESTFTIVGSRVCSSSNWQENLLLLLVRRFTAEHTYIWIDEDEDDDEKVESSAVEAVAYVYHKDIYRKIL